MSNLDVLYRDLVTPPSEPSSVPGRKNITLRLPKDVHNKLDDIRALGSQSKTVMAEELLISAIEDVHHRMVIDERLESWWADRAEYLAEQEQLAIDRAVEDADFQASGLSYLSYSQATGLEPLPAHEVTYTEVKS